MEDLAKELDKSKQTKGMTLKQKKQQAKKAAVSKKKKNVPERAYDISSQHDDDFIKHEKELESGKMLGKERDQLESGKTTQAKDDPASVGEKRNHPIRLQSKTKKEQNKKKMIMMKQSKTRMN